MLDRSGAVAGVWVSFAAGSSATPTPGAGTGKNAIARRPPESSGRVGKKYLVPNLAGIRVRQRRSAAFCRQGDCPLSIRRSPIEFLFE